MRSKLQEQIVNYHPLKQVACNSPCCGGYDWQVDNCQTGDVYRSHLVCQLSEVAG